MSLSKTAIEANRISKRYRLGVINRGMLYQDLQSYWARLRGKPDPHAPLNPDGTESDHKIGEFWALRDVSFSLEQGEAMAIIGKNGSGKSTLLKILSQITAPTTGEARIRGRVASMLEVGTGFHSELTGRANVYINGAILGMTKREIDVRFDDIVGFAGVERFIDTPVKRYSSGMSVRLAFSVAAHLAAEILIVDEVLAVGDSDFQRKCLGKMAQIVREGRTILFVSHNMQIVRSLCSRALLLESGVATRSGQSDEVIRYYLRGKDENYHAREEPPVPGPSTPLFPSLLTLRDTCGNTRAEFHLGEDWCLDVLLDVRKAVSDFRLQVNVNEADNFCALAHSSKNSTLKPGRYKVSFTFVEKLRAGEYRFTLLSFSGSRVLHSLVSELVVKIDHVPCTNDPIRWFSYGGVVVSSDEPDVVPTTEY